MRVLTVAAAVLAAAMMLVGWMLYDLRRAAERGAEQASINLALTLETYIDRSIGVFDLSLQAAARAASLIDLPSLSPEIRQDLLFDGAAKAPYLAAILLTDATGHVVYSSRSPTPPSIDLSDRPYFRVHQTDRDADLQFGIVPANRLTGEDVLVMSRRIERPDGSFAGIVSGGIQLGLFRSRFEALNVGSGGSIALYTADTRLIARAPPRPGDLGRNLRNPDAFALVLRSGSAMQRGVSGIDGVERFFVSRRIGSLPLVIVVGRAVEDVYADWRHEATLVGCAMGVLVALTGVLLGALSRALRKSARAERLALKSASEMQLVSDHIGDLVLKIDWDGTQRYVSAACETMLGYTARELLGRDWLDLAHEDDRPGMRNTLGGMLAGRTHASEFTYRVGHRDGAGRVFEARGQALPDRTGAIVVARDVTDRLLLERQLRQAQRMEVLGRLSAGVAHDFNNLLQAQIGSLELLKEAIDIADAAAATRHGATAMRMAERGAYLTNHLLSFSRQQVLRPRPVSLDDALGDTAQVLGRTLGPRVDMRVEVAPDTGAALVDPHIFEVALLNLAFNASDAMPNGGALTIAARRTSIGETGHATLGAGDYVVTSVADEGCGMSAETCARAIEPFFTTKGTNGSGLGLAMVHGFAKQSGGDLSIESAPGRGTRVTLWLPATATAAEERRPAPAPAVRRVGRALIVDDAPDVLVAVGAFVESSGFDVTKAESGEAALALVQAGQHFDVLVTDFAMPGMNGAELARDVQAIVPNLPILVITGYVEQAVLESLPGVRVLAKPFRSETLARAIQDAMSAVADRAAPVLDGVAG